MGKLTQKYDWMFKQWNESQLEYRCRLCTNSTFCQLVTENSSTTFIRYAKYWITTQILHLDHIDDVTRQYNVDHVIDYNKQGNNIISGSGGGIRTPTN